MTRHQSAQQLWAIVLMVFLYMGKLPSAAQTYIPGSIVRPADRPQLPWVISWHSIPGKNYEILGVEELGEPWRVVNSSPIKAKSTVTEFPGDPSILAHFFRVREQAVPAGNNSAITTAALAEMEKVIGLTFTPAQRSQMLEIINGSVDFDNRRAYENMRRRRLFNSDVPALVFDPKPRNFSLAQVQRQLQWSAPKRTTLPTDRAALAFFSVRELAELIRTRQITSLELTQLYLERLKRYDKDLRCVISLTEELALKQAARADAEIGGGTYRGLLHGIPYGLKDAFTTKGYKTTWGAAPFRDQVLDEDAAVVRRLEAAGAVLVAKLSLGSLANGDVWFGGMTRNPWNVGEGSSGSSAGSAAATAAGLVAFAIGTEALGSIVSPCTRCRVTGLRTTFGRISRAGALALSWSMDKIGPICRTVEDCGIVLDAIRGSDPMDSAAVDIPFNYDSGQNLQSLRVGYRSAYVGSAIVNRLATFVPRTNIAAIKLPSYPYEAMALVLDAEAAAAFDELTRFGGDAFLTSQGTLDWPNVFRVARTIPAVEYIQADRLRKQLIEDMAQLFDTIDLFVTTNNDSETVYLTNLTGHPCVVVPNGGATSLNFIGKLYDEATILAVAKAYQDFTGFHTNRPPRFIQ